MDYDGLARDILRALRGKRSQTAFSRRLGYRSNVAYAWEAGRRWPTAAETFRAAERVGIDVRAAVAPFFYRELPGGLGVHAPATPAFAAALLRELRGRAPLSRLAERTGLSRSAVSRILSGKTQPRLPVFLRLVDAASRRVLDLLAGFVDLERVPSVRDEWLRLDRIRRLSTESPLFETVPRALELDAYTKHAPGWIAERLGVPVSDEERTLRDLELAGLIRWDGDRWEVDRERSVDTTRFAPRASATLHAHWTRVAAERIPHMSSDEASFAYLVFTTDDETLAKLRELHLRYFRELRALAASAPHNTRIAVATMHVFPIDTPSAG